MIYTVISDYRKLLPEIMNGEGEIDSPFRLLPSRLKAHITEPKNKEVSLSRLGSYLLLFHTVRFLFGEIDFEIDFTDCGKPYFSGEKMKDISFNVSHSEGLCAVSVCDEPLSVGVDIQHSVDSKKEERLHGRIYQGSMKSRDLPEVVYLFGGFSAYGDCMFAEIPPSSLRLGEPDTDFTDRWSLFEALMKCDGRGFSAQNEIEDMLKIVATHTVKLSYKGNKYSVSTAVK